MVICQWCDCADRSQVITVNAAGEPIQGQFLGLSEYYASCKRCGKEIACKNWTCRCQGCNDWWWVDSEDTDATEDYASPDEPSDFE